MEPAAGEFDPAQMAHYREVLAELRRQGMSAMVTLHHFTSPLWFTARGGWAASGAVAAWLPFVTRVAEELGDLVDFWCTLNEPNIYAFHGWMEGEFPPARRADVAGMFRVLANLRRAHAAAYRKLKRLTPAVPVGLAQHKWVVEPASRRSRDRLITGLARAAMDRWPASSGRLQRVVEAPSDYIGLNHYSGCLVAFDGRRPLKAFMHRFNPPYLAESDFGWVVQPAWLGRCLDELSGLGRPIYITENGVAAADDGARQDFLVEVLGQLWESIRSGADVRGYFHWSSMDNFEWARGYAMRFGLIAVDRQTQRRTVKPSGRLFAEIARTNALAVGDGAGAAGSGIG